MWASEATYLVAIRQHALVQPPEVVRGHARAVLRQPVPGAVRHHALHTVNVAVRRAVRGLWLQQGPVYRPSSPYG